MGYERIRYNHLMHLPQNSCLVEETLCHTVNTADLSYTLSCQLKQLLADVHEGKYVTLSLSLTVQQGYTAQDVVTI